MQSSVVGAAQRFAPYEPWLLLLAPCFLFPGPWTLPATLVLVCGAVCRWVAQRSLSVPTFANIPLPFLIGSVGLALAVSPDRSQSLPEFWRILFGIGVFYILANGIRHAGHTRLAAYLLAISGIGAALMTLFGTDWAHVRFAALPGLYGRLPALLVDFSDQRAFHPRIMGMALAMLFPVCLALAAGGRDRRLRVLAGGAALVMAAILPLTQALQAAIGVGAALFFLAVWRTRWALLAAPILLELLYWAGTRRDLQALALQLISTRDIAGIGVALRLDMWSRAWDMFRDMPLTGAGLNSFPIMVWHFYPGYLIGPEPHAHNLLLQLAVDLGLPGLVAFLGLIAGAGVTVVGVLRRTQDPDTRMLVAGLAAGGVAYLASGTMDTLWPAKPGILLWILMGVLAGTAHLVAHDAGKLERHARQPRHAAATRVGWAISALALVVTLAMAAAIPTVRATAERNLGMLQAQRVLLALRQGSPAGAQREDQLAEARARLERSLPEAGDDPHPYARLASVCAWQGDDEAALAALAEQVIRDGRDPIGRYAPFEAARRRLSADTPGDPWADLLAVYGQWMTRFPQRAETYAAAAIVYERHLADAGSAQAALEAGLKHGAQPAGLLQTYLAQLTGG